jgi:hypothetical protein
VEAHLLEQGVDKGGDNSAQGHHVNNGIDELSEGKL